HRARHARVLDAVERHEPPARRLEPPAHLHRTHPARRGSALERKTLVKLAIVLVALSLSACKQKAGPDVAFLLSTLQEERYQKDVRYFEARANELGLHVVTLAADNDNAKQIAQVEDVLTQGAKVLVIQPTDSQAASSYVRL